MKRPIEVHFTVMVDDNEKERLYTEAKESGNGYDDAGPLLAIRRYLMSVGIDGAFQGINTHGLEFTLHSSTPKE